MIKSDQTCILTCDCGFQAWIVEEVDENDHIYSLTCSKCGYRVPEDIDYGGLLPGLWIPLKKRLHLKRIEIVQRAIMVMRSTVENLQDLGGIDGKHPLTYGAYGLLEYIKTGDLLKIKVRTLREAVKKIIKEVEDSKEFYSDEYTHIPEEDTKNGN